MDKYILRIEWKDGGEGEIEVSSYDFRIKERVLSYVTTYGRTNWCNFDYIIAFDIEVLNEGVV